jgi:hypothetical protein
MIWRYVPLSKHSERYKTGRKTRKTWSTIPVEEQKMCEHDFRVSVSYLEKCAACGCFQKTERSVVLSPTTFWRFQKQGTGNLGCLLSDYSMLLITLNTLRRQTHY